ncbi:MAG: DUF5312 domain-containing protein [Treponema sp.]|jgi:hypothetical protein|nr:DUF5312 domain-containing protein [Treponema sp.]
MAGFLERITGLFSELFSQSSSSESDKKKLLKALSQDIIKSKYGKFLKVKALEITPQFGKFFYDVYKLVSPIQVLMVHAERSAQLKQVVIEFFMDKAIQDIQKQLDPNFIEISSNTSKIKDIVQKVKADTAAFRKFFPPEKITVINQYYNLILTFIQFISFHFYDLVKKFDPKITEYNFTYQPQFNAIKAERITEDLEDFLEVSYNLRADCDWETVFNIIKMYKGDIKNVDAVLWKKLIIRLQDMNRDGIFIQMVRYISQDPVWQFKPITNTEHIAEPYVEKIVNAAQSVVDRIIFNQKTRQADELAQTIFGVNIPARLKYYTEEANAAYLKKGFDGFEYVTEINYLKSFMTSFFDSKIREFYDIMIVRGQWLTNATISKELSDSFNELGGIMEKINAFDDMLAENKDRGGRLRLAITKIDRDKGQIRIIKGIIHDINEEARQIINTAMLAFITMRKYIYSIIEFSQRSPADITDIIRNWKELEATLDIPIVQWLKGIYQKIHDFIKLMQLFSTDSGNT